MGLGATAMKCPERGCAEPESFSVPAEGFKGQVMTWHKHPEEALSEQHRKERRRGNVLESEFGWHEPQR